MSSSSGSPSGSPSKLNPDAKEWNPATESSSEEFRCLFITFSNGCSLSHQQLWCYFNKRFKPYVESIYVHDPNWPHGSAQFGRIKFKARTIAEQILGGREETKIMIADQPVLCKRYDPSKKNCWPHKGESSSNANA